MRSAHISARSRPDRCGLVVPIALLVACAGCISIQTSGTSTRKQKQAIVKSSAFQLSKALYPGDTVRQVAVRFPELERKQIRTVRTAIDQQARALVLWYRQHQRTLADRLERPLGEVRRLAVEVTNVGEPIAYVDETATLHVDVKVAQGFFLGSLVEGMVETDAFGRELRRTDEQPSDLKLLSAFLERRGEVEGTEGRTLLGDVLWSDDPFALGELAEVIARTNRKYVGTFLFLIAHELGHLALGHFADDVERSVHDLEFEADRFAIHATVGIVKPLLFQHALMPIGEIGASARDLLGYLDLFRYGYQRAGFADDVGPDAYPTAEERIAQADVVYRQAMSQLDEAAERAWAEAWDRALAKLRSQADDGAPP